MWQQAWFREILCDIRICTNYCEELRILKLLIYKIWNSETYR